MNDKIKLHLWQHIFIKNNITKHQYKISFEDFYTDILFSAYKLSVN